MTARSLTVFLGSLLSIGPAYADAPTMGDYSRGVRVEAESGRPLVEMTLPDEVYLGATRTDFGDVRVFNAEGISVPHAFCASAETSPPEVAEQALPVYELRDALQAATGGSSIEVQTPAGTQVRVQDPGDDVAEVQNGRTHIIDAREIEQPLRAIQFDWTSPDGASEARVRIEESGDLDRWNVLVTNSSLLHARRGDQEIKRERIELPLQPYKYLRVQRADGGPPLQINSVVAERVSPAREIEPVWFTPATSTTPQPGIVQFDAGRVAPVQFARLQMAIENSSVHVRLQSRPGEKQAWSDRWGGEVYLIVTQTERRESPAARLAPTTDRFWRMQLDTESRAVVPMLQLGYRPARLRFLAQGSSPFTIAFGSRRASVSAPARCDSLLADVSSDDMASMIAQGYPVGVASPLGGEAALKPLPQKTPLRLIILWGVLMTGVVLLIAMALSLLKRVRPTGE